VYTGSADGKIRIFDVNTTEIVKTLYVGSSFSSNRETNQQISSNNRNDSHTSTIDGASTSTSENDHRSQSSSDDESDYDTENEFDDSEAYSAATLLFGTFLGSHWLLRGAPLDSYRRGGSSMGNIVTRDVSWHPDLPLLISTNWVGAGGGWGNGAIVRHRY